MKCVYRSRYPVNVSIHVNETTLFSIRYDGQLDFHSHCFITRQATPPFEPLHVQDATKRCSCTGIRAHAAYAMQLEPHIPLLPKLRSPNSSRFAWKALQLQKLAVLSYFRSPARSWIFVLLFSYLPEETRQPSYPSISLLPTNCEVYVRREQAGANSFRSYGISFDDIQNPCARPDHPRTADAHIATTPD